MSEFFLHLFTTPKSRVVLKGRPSKRLGLTINGLHEIDFHYLLSPEHRIYFTYDEDIMRYIPIEGLFIVLYDEKDDYYN